MCSTNLRGSLRLIVSAGFMNQHTGSCAKSLPRVWLSAGKLLKKEVARNNQATNNFDEAHMKLGPSHSV